MTHSTLDDRAAITDLIYGYCRSVDRLDVPLGRAIWHSDGWADYGPEVYQGPGREVIDHICAQHTQTLHHSHQVTNILIDINGDRAGSEAYCFATLRVDRSGTLMQMSVWSRYVDRWERREGYWGLVHRLAIRDFDEAREVREMQRHTVGTRDTRDPSYAVLSA